jgi:hypothetical protein
MVAPCCSRSSTPTTSHTWCSAAIAPSRSAAGPGTTTALSASSPNHSSSSSQIAWVSIQIGVPGTNTSGNTTRSAPSRAAAAVSSATRSMVASRSIST